MSGFLAMRRSTFAAGRDFNPVGYKIGLELLIKCHCQRVVEIPIHFCDRRLGESKLSITEQLKYLQHLRRLYLYKYGTWSHLARFLAIGLSGTVVDLVLLTLFLTLGVGANPAVALSILVSMVWNFFLNRRLSFSYARSQSILRQFGGYLTACSVGAVVNFSVTVTVWPAFQYKQLAAIVGVVAGVAFNFVASRFAVFRQRHLRRPHASAASAPASRRGDARNTS